MSFWANKINGNAPAPVAPPSRDLYGMYNPVTIPNQPQPQQSIPQQNYVPQAHLIQGGNCPGCGSSNYIPHPPGNPERTISCSECGYNPRFQQSTYGLPSLANDKTVPVHAARQTGERSSLEASIAQLNAGGGDHIVSL